MRLLFLTPVFCALVKFAMAPKLSLWVRTVPPAVLPLLAMMAAIPLVCGLALAGLGPIWIAATVLTLMGSMALLKGLALAREDVDLPGAVSKVDAALCESAYMDALFGAAAGEVVGTVAVLTAGVLVPDLKDHSSRVFRFSFSSSFVQPCR